MFESRYIDIAIQQAMKSTMKHKYGAVLISTRGEILNVGYNRYCSFRSTRLKNKPTTFHAEMNACKKVPRKKIRGLL